MDSSSYGWRTKKPCSHHHHHHHHHHHRFFLCPHHHHHHQCSVLHCPLHCSLLHSNIHRFNHHPPPQYSKPVDTISSPNNFNFQADYNQTYTSDARVMQEGNERLEEEKEEDDEEEEEEEDFVFVLTDEWKEFFAKSEAKRRLAKKQAKKKGKD